MTPDVVVRRALWATAVFNVFGALLFAFPASLPGRLAGLPPDVPLVYRAMVAVFVLLFGGSYAWLAQARPMNRPLLALGAIGKASAFVTVALLWMAGAAPFQSVAAIFGDLAFAALFAWYLMTAPRS